MRTFICLNKVCHRLLVTYTNLVSLSSEASTPTAMIPLFEGLSSLSSTSKSIKSSIAATKNDTGVMLVAP